MRSALLHQQSFRVLLRALSRPGKRCRLPLDPDGRPVDGFRVVLETLLDIEVTFALVGTEHSLSEQEIIGWTHSRTAAPGEADFLVVDGLENGAVLDRLKRGSPEAPDTSATAIFLLPDNAAQRDSESQVRLSGPGIGPGQTAIVELQGVPWPILGAIRRINAEFPCGIDCFFLYPDGGVVGLPRSVAIEEV